jgi:hypothetical protein
VVPLNGFLCHPALNTTLQDWCANAWTNRISCTRIDTAIDDDSNTCRLEADGGDDNYKIVGVNHVVGRYHTFETVYSGAFAVQCIWVCNNNAHAIGLQVYTTENVRTRWRRRMWAYRRGIIIMYNWCLTKELRRRRWVPRPFSFSIVLYFCLSSNSSFTGIFEFLKRIFFYSTF